MTAGQRASALLAIDTEDNPTPPNPSTKSSAPTKPSPRPASEMQGSGFGFQARIRANMGKKDYASVIEELLRRLHSLVERECLASLMNNTKWMEVMAAVSELNLRCRAKLLTDAEPTRWGGLWTPARPFVEGIVGSPVHVFEIEWLEIEAVQRVRRGALVPDRVIDKSEELERRLRSSNVPFTREEVVFRVTGHIRKENGEPG